MGRSWFLLATPRWLKTASCADHATTDQVEAVATALRRLPALIPELRDYRVGPDLGVDPGNGSFVVIADFDDVAGYVTYRDHPEHQAVAREYIIPILAGRQAAQYTL